MFHLNFGRVGGGAGGGGEAGLEAENQEGRGPGIGGLGRPSQKFQVATKRKKTLSLKLGGGGRRRGRGAGERGGGRRGRDSRVGSAMNGLAVEGWASLCARPVRPGSADHIKGSLGRGCRAGLMIMLLAHQLSSIFEKPPRLNWTCYVQIRRRNT